MFVLTFTNQIFSQNGHYVAHVAYAHGTHVELCNFTNVIEINHLNMIDDLAFLN
jgi:hypothetical protein